MKVTMISLRYLFFMTILLGGVYPFLVLGIGEVLFPIRSQGSLIKEGDKIIGSELIAQKFTQDKYFWSRPSAIDYSAQSSGASQKSGTSQDLKLAYDERVKILGEKAPIDMLTASGSGLDPHISIESAVYQKVRVKEARKITDKEIDMMISMATEERFLGFMGQPRVNVLKLNQLLDKR